MSTSSRGYSAFLLVSLSCLFVSRHALLALDTDTAVIASDGSQLVATDSQGNTATNTNDGSGNVASDFNVAGNSGKASANSASDGSTLGANGPNGEQLSGTVDSAALGANFQDGSGNSVVAKSQPGGNGKSNVVVNGDKNYLVDRPDGDKVLITDQQSGGVYKIAGISTQKQVDIVSADGKQFQAAMDKSANGDVSTKLKQKTFLNFGPASASQLTAPNSQNDGSVKLGYNPLDAGAANPLSSTPPAVTITVDKINTKPCPEKEYGDAFGENGFKIVDDTISVELPPVSDDGAQKTYAFPGCFIMKAQVKIPPNIDPHNIGGQVQATMSVAGDLQCDSSLECKATAQNKPTGSCFFCDFCEKDSASQKSNLVFGSAAETEWNLCSGKPGNQLPLSWKVCPKDGANAYNVLQPQLLNMKGDIEATIKIYVKTDSSASAGTASAANKPAICNTPLGIFYAQCKGASGGAAGAAGQSWQMVGCRKTIISYKLSALNGAVNYGSSAGIFGRRR